MELHTSCTLTAFHIYPRKMWKAGLGNTQVVSQLLTAGAVIFSLGVKLASYPVTGWCATAWHGGGCV